MCRRHELYVSFQDLGWLVRSTPLLHDDPRRSRVSPGGVDWVFLCVFFMYYFLLGFPSVLDGECDTFMVKRCFLVKTVKMETTCLLSHKMSGHKGTRGQAAEPLCLCRKQLREAGAGSRSTTPSTTELVPVLSAEGLGVDARLGGWGSCSGGAEDE